MVDNSSLPVASGNETFANDDIGGVKYPRPKVNWGPDGTANDVDVASGKPLPVQLRGSDGTDVSLVIGVAADAASTTTTIKAALRGIATALGITALDLGSGTGGSRTLRWFLDTAQWIGGAGAVTSATQRTTLASDDPLVSVTGAKTDAKSTATDATSISAMSVWKQISASVQALVTAALPTGWGVASAAGRVVSAPSGFTARVSVTRPSDTTTYAAGDVVGVTGGGTGTITFPNMGFGAGDVMITSLRFQRNAAALIASEVGYKLHLFNVTQPGAQADNAVFDVAAGDQASYLGFIPIPTPTDLGSTLHSQVDGINKQIALASTSLFGVLTTDGAYQPVSAAVHVVELHTVAV